MIPRGPFQPQPFCDSVTFRVAVLPFAAEIVFHVKIIPVWELPDPICDY